MTTAPPSALMTADEFYHLKLPEDGNRYELVRGKVVCMSPASPRSNIIAMLIVAALVTWVRPRNLGVVGGSEGGLKLASDPDTVRAPDVWFFRAERIPPGGVPDHFCPGAPDLAVEVLSPSDRSGQITERLNDYFAAGVRLVWLIEPRTKSAAVFHADQMPFFVLADGALDGNDVLPGFTLPLRDLFD